MLEKRRPFNYWYFGFFLIFIMSLSVVQLLALADGSSSFYLLFLVDAILQSGLEVLLCLFLATLFGKFFPRAFFYFFIALTIFVIFLHLVDFFLVRLLDFTIWFALDFVLEDKAKNFFELLDASNISLLAWNGVFLGIVFFIALGLFIYKKTETLSQKKETLFSMPIQSLSMATVVLSLLFWDFSTRPFFSFAEAEKFTKALPFKRTFFSHPTPTIFLPARLRSPPADPYQAPLKAAKHKPDIFLFVVESLREDFITPSISPNIYAFKKENQSFDLALSSSNGTHISWFSLFFSQHPFHFRTSKKKAQKEGSPSLALLKKMGYEIHLYSASHLNYYQMDEVLFGEKHKLADSFFFYPHAKELAPYQSDEKVIKHLQHDLFAKKTEAPRLFVIFLDSTHFDYSWNPENTIFTPVAQGAGYWKALFGKADIKGIQNRYRNAFFHIDSLFGNFLKTLRSTPRANDSIVFFTSDHGEEFCEKGFLFHASHLTREQTHIPLYLSFGKNITLPSENKSKFVSHLDLFPTLFHVICQEEPPPGLFEGESIFKENRWPFLVTARYNAGRTPFEFFVHDGEKKLVMQFANRFQIQISKAVKIMSVTTDDDTPLPIATVEAKKRFNDALLKLFPSP